MRNMGKNMRGFTLIEIMVVVAIIGIMAVIAIPNFTTLTPHQQLMLTLKSLAGMINEGKARALFTQNQHNVIIDIANRRISLVDTITGEVIDLFNFPGSVTIGPIQGWGMSLTFPFNALPNNTITQCVIFVTLLMGLSQLTQEEKFLTIQWYLQLEVL